MYSLKHIGAITINKSQGETLPLGLAVEITEKYSPWEKGQIVVVLSRTNNASSTIVVGDKQYAIQKMWEIITKGTQWTKFTMNVLNMITINQIDNNQNNYSIDYNKVYPFRITDGDIIPTDRTGYIYCLISKRYHDEIYIGQTQCLSQRLINHNSGHGSYSTNSIQKRPWAVAAYICGLSHLSRIERLSMERRWKNLVEDLKIRGYNDTLSWINAGSRIVEMYNNSNQDNKINFIRLVNQVNT